MPSISALIRSRTSRAVLTQSNSRSHRSLIFNNLARGPDLQEWISPLQIDGIVGMDTSQVDDVLEIPAHQHIDSGDRCKGDVQSIGAHASTNCPVGDVGGRELLGFLRHGEHFNEVRVNERESVTNSRWRRLQLTKRELRDHKAHVATSERLQEPTGGTTKLAVLGSSDH